MSDIRFDPITEHWVTVAPNRNDRPVEFIANERIVKRILCPFCAGNELETPASLACYNEAGEKVDDDKPWLVRVFSNKYPAFSVPSEDVLCCEEIDHGDGLYKSTCSPGVQELVIPTSEHHHSLSQLTEEENFVTHLAYRDRVEAASHRESMQHAMLFTNCRSSAGASLEHIHTQLMVTPIISQTIRGQLDRNRQYRSDHGQHLIHALTDWELSKENRVVDRSENFSVTCPFASRFAFQMRIVPNAHVPSFLQCPESILKELATLSKKQILRLESVLDQPAYNVLFHLPPFAEMEEQPWFVEIFPRITTPAGFEMGTDIWVNPVSPEVATRRLRQRTEKK